MSVLALWFTALLYLHEVRIRREEKADADAAQARLIFGRVVEFRAPAEMLTSVRYEVANHSAAPTDVSPSNVETRDDFARFLSAVLADFRSTGAAEWENGTLDRFLDGLSAFTDARVGASEPDQEQASWRLFAEIVRAATGYE